MNGFECDERMSMGGVFKGEQRRYFVQGIKSVNEFLAKNWDCTGKVARD